MDLNRDPSTIASAAADEVRALNHRTLDQKAFGHPGDVSDTADAVAVLVERLPQTIDQLSQRLQRMEERQAIRMDDGTDPGVRASEALRALINARLALSTACGALREATAPLSHMGGHWEDAEEDDAVV